MTGFEMPTVEPYQPQMCICGHPIGDHKSNRARGLSLRFGVCLREGCGCRGFVDRDDPEPPAAAA